MDRMESGNSFDFTNSMEQHGVWWERGREQNPKAANFPKWNCLAFGTNQPGTEPQFFSTYHLFSTHHCVFVVMLLLSSSTSTPSSTRLQGVGEQGPPCGLPRLHPHLLDPGPGLAYLWQQHLGRWCLWLYIPCLGTFNIYTSLMSIQYWKFNKCILLSFSISVRTQFHHMRIFWPR